jgi:PPOX class probable F420-dependent enzyme
VPVARLPQSARELIESGPLAHLVTLNADGSPQVTCVWMGLDGDELVAGHLFRHHKIRNIERDPRVVATFEGTFSYPPGLKAYLRVHGRAHVTEGGAPELLQRLAHVYIGPGVKFPPMPDPPPGFVTHITVELIGGLGDWTPPDSREGRLFASIVGPR